MGIVPVVTAAATAYAANETVKQQKKQESNAREQQAVAEEQAKSEQEKMEKLQEETNRRRRNALQSQISSKRAEMAASGVSSTGGSADALFKGMVDEVKEEEETDEYLNSYSVTETQRNLETRRRQNLFTLSAQRSRTSLSAGVSTVESLSPLAIKVGGQLL